MESSTPSRMNWMAWATPLTAMATLFAALLSSSALPIPPANADTMERTLLAGINDRCQQNSWNHVGGMSFKWTNSLLPPSTNASLNATN
ncbi:MAG TPA: hypothetical protein VMF06_16770 [Candidatus Limnocylindria bacterium]|nr:hypothetical protein [Candidatus Limnocylindria bacterium]